MAKHPHDLLTQHLARACPKRRGITAAKGLDEGGYLIDQRAQVGRLDVPALGELADQEMGVGVDEAAVFRWRLARTLDVANQALRATDQRSYSALLLAAP